MSVCISRTRRSHKKPYMNNNNKIHSLFDRIKNPPSTCYPVYSWKWDGKLTEKRICEDIDAFYGCGIRGFYIIPEPEAFRPATMRTFLEPEYLSDRYLKLVRAAAEHARKKGMVMWLYDEGGWPSGSACGQVVSGHPELRQRELVQNDIVLKSGEAFEGDECTVALFRGTKRLLIPYTAEKEEKLTEYRVSVTGAPDRLSPAAVGRFIELTHERHAKHLGGLVGSYIPIFFTDEPKPSGRVPWFDADTGGFSDILPALFDSECMGKAGKLGRIRYYDALGRRFAETFNGSLRKWCAGHGMLLGGHMSNEDEPAAVNNHGGHLMRSLRVMDVPGVDTIWRQIFPSNEADNMFFPRFASSAAAQNGGLLAMSESFAVYGAGLTMSEMRYVVGFQAVRGINIFNYMLISFYKNGTPVHHERPDFQPGSPACVGLDVHNTAVSRVCAFLSEGKPERKTALYYPFCDIWAGGPDAERAARLFTEAGRRLETSQCDFEIIDDDVAERFGAFNEIVIPECVYMPEKTRIALEKSKAVLTYYSGGGLEGRFPVVKTDCKSIRAAKQIAQGGERLYFIFNEGLERVTARLGFPDTGFCLMFDFESGELTPHVGEPVTLESGESRGFIFTDKELYPAQQKTAVLIEEKVINEFLISPVRKTVVLPDGFHNVSLKQEPQRAGVDGWLSILGDDFSGTADYTMRFTAPKGTARAEIFCGDVFCVCEVMLNGKSIGTRTAKPYLFQTSEVRDGENELCLRVTNTLANQYVKNIWREGLEQRDIGPYNERTAGFERDSVKGGIYGHVKIRLYK